MYSNHCKKVKHSLLMRFIIFRLILEAPGGYAFGSISQTFLITVMVSTHQICTLLNLWYIFLKSARTLLHSTLLKSVAIPVNIKVFMLAFLTTHSKSVPVKILPYYIIDLRIGIFLANSYSSCPV